MKINVTYVLGRLRWQWTSRDSLRLVDSGCLRHRRSRFSTSFTVMPILHISELVFCACEQTDKDRGEQQQHERNDEQDLREKSQRLL
jgi:hypothetical protein